MTNDARAALRDPNRLHEVEHTGPLAAQSRPALDRLTRLAARLLRSPVALVNLVDADRQVSVARCAPESWPSRDETPLSESFCKFAVVSGEPLRIDDAGQDERVADTGAVTDLGVGSYLGVPLRSSAGHVLGTLCVLDFAPRDWSDEEVETLRELTAAVMTEIELRKAVRETEEAERLAEVAERERREKSALLESTSEGIYGIDLEGSCTFINQAAARVLGYAPEECLGRNMHALIHHSHPDGSPFPEEECPIYHAIRESRAVRLDDQVLWRKDGSSFSAEYSASPIREEGALRGAVVTLVDISERKRREDAERLLNHAGKVLTASTLDYAATLRSLVRIAVPALGDWCSLHLVREDGGVERLEIAHSDPDRQAPAERLKRYALRSGDDHPAMRVLRSGEPLLLREVPDATLRAAAHDDEHLEILRSLGIESAMVVPLVARGRTLGVLTIVSSTPGRCYSEDDLAVAREFSTRAALAVDNARLFQESQEANRTKADFLATVSHELRTPLNAIIGYTSLMCDGVPVSLPPAALEYLQRIDLSSRHLRQLIEEILSFSRLEAGQETVAIGVVPLPELISEVEAIVQPLAEEKGLEFRVARPESTRPLRTDPAKVRQILVNLLDNAVKFTREGRVELRVDVEEDRVRFLVRDTGKGIPVEDQGKIFEPFRQLEQSNVREAGGTGLGLSVAQRLVRLLGGSMQLESEPGQGTTVRVWLPREAPSD